MGAEGTSELSQVSGAVGGRGGRRRRRREGGGGCE